MGCAVQVMTANPNRLKKRGTQASCPCRLHAYNERNHSGRRQLVRILPGFLSVDRSVVFAERGGAVTPRPPACH